MTVLGILALIALCVYSRLRSADGDDFENSPATKAKRNKVKSANADTKRLRDKSSSLFLSACAGNSLCQSIWMFTFRP